MKKTLKILMAIILFAVVLTVATSVNATSPSTTPKGTTADVAYDNLAAAVAGEKGVAVEADRLVIQEGTTYTVQHALFLKDLDAPSGSIIILKAALTVAEKVNITNTVTIANAGVAAGTFTADKGVEVKTSGVVYTDIKAFEAANYGRIFASEDLTTAPTGNTKLVLKKDSVTGKPVANGKDTVYAEVYVPTTSVVGADSKITITFKVTKPGETSAATKLESGKEYSYAIEAKWNGLVLDGSEVASTVPYAEVDKIPNIEAGDIAEGTDKSEGTITIPTGLTEGSKIYLTVTVAGQKLTVELTVGAGVAVDDKNQQEQPAEPTKPADENKGDLDDSPKTGDHIIPAATLLAVVVVANVVYFAKSKNN